VHGSLLEEAVFYAVERRLADPRWAREVAARVAATADARARIEAEIARLNMEADALSEKTARWGVERVDRQMEPLLARIGVLTEELGELDLPGRSSWAEDMVAAWRQAQHDGDLGNIRAMISGTFPDLTLRPPHRPGRRGEMTEIRARLALDGPREDDLLEEPPSRVEQIRAVLAAHPRGVTVPEIVALTGMDHSVAYRHIARLVKAGEAVKLRDTDHNAVVKGALYGPPPTDRQ
jgi:hypothetical protein